MAKMDYRKARSPAGDSYRWSAPSLNTGHHVNKTPDEIKAIRRQFLINCVRAEMRGERYPGVPRVLKGTDLLLRGSATAILRMWVEQQSDLQEAIAWVRERDAGKAQPAR